MITLLVCIILTWQLYSGCAGGKFGAGLSTLYLTEVAMSDFSSSVSLGLQLGYFLQRSGKDYVIFEKNTTAGEAAQCQCT